MQGHCLCGAIQVSTADHHDVTICHYGMCRRWAGGPAPTVHCGSDVEIRHGGALTVFASSEWAERGFCSLCGGHVYYRLLPTGEYMLPVGLFGDAVAFTLVSQIYVDHKPGWYDFANPTTMLTEAEIFAMYAP